MNKVLSIKSGKTVGSGKVVLLIFLTVLISRQKAISVFSLNGLAVKVFNLLILECPLTLERSEINRKPTFPLFPNEDSERAAFPLFSSKRGISKAVNVAALEVPSSFNSH